MRIDKYLKVSRIIKRRSVANEACDGGRVMLNGKVCKAGAEVKSGDIIKIKFHDEEAAFMIKHTDERLAKRDLEEMYTVL